MDDPSNPDASDSAAPDEPDWPERYPPADARVIEINTSLGPELVIDISVMIGGKVRGATNDRTHPLYGIKRLRSGNKTYAFVRRDDEGTLHYVMDERVRAREERSMVNEPPSVTEEQAAATDENRLNNIKKQIVLQVLELARHYLPNRKFNLQERLRMGVQLIAQIADSHKVVVWDARTQVGKITYKELEKLSDELRTWGSRLNAGDSAKAKRDLIADALIAKEDKELN